VLESNQVVNLPSHATSSTYIFTVTMVQRIVRQAGLDAFIKAVEQDGCVIIQDFTDAESLEQAQTEVQPFLDESAAASRSTVGALNGGTATCTRLIGRSKTVREKFFSDSLYQVCLWR
jgi:hypothetical protein